LAGFGVCFVRFEIFKRLFFLPMLMLALAASISHADVLAILTDQSARVVNRGSTKHCNADASLRIEVIDASFFEQRQSDLGTLYGSALNQIYARCPNLKTVKVYGMVDNFEVVKARASGASGWVLQMELSKLDKVAASIRTDIRSYDDLPKLKKLFAPFQKVNGISNTAGYLAFATNSKNVVDFLNLRPENFEQFATKHAAASDPVKALKAVEDVLEVVAYYDPRRASSMRGEYGQTVERVANVEIETVLASTLIPQTSVSVAVAKISAQVKKKPLTHDTLALVDDRMSQWMTTQVDAHETENGGDYLDAAKAHFAFSQSLDGEAFSDQLPASRTAVQTASFWFETHAEEILSDVLGQAYASIAETGHSFTDVDFVLETGLSLAEEFEKFGFSEEADYVVEAAMTRSEALIDDGLQEYVAQLSAEPMTRAAIARYRDEAATFYELSEDFPGFTAYYEGVEAGIRSGIARQCQAQFQRLSNPRTVDSRYDVGSEVVGLGELTCALYENGNVLEDITVARNGATGSMRVTTADEAEVRFDLVSDSPNVLTGRGESWFEDIQTLIVKSPVGKPNINGVTECDILAGDPSDKSLPVEGVNFETAPDDYDFDRAIEACIAAVEHDTDATRQVYQLARVLEFLGDAETAKHYIEIAVVRKYAPGLHLKAFSILTNRDDEDAFFDAVDLFKAAAAMGYAPSKAELAEMIPPGADIYREIPPPTDTEVLDTVGRKKCGGTSLMSACSVRTGVHKKNCMQTSETQFSCEIVLRHKCQVNSSMGRDPVMGFFTGMIANSCSPTTDPMYLQFTKRSKGWVSRKEF
jgi:hypothetical protein